jgi:hypothetical protein
MKEIIYSLKSALECLEPYRHQAIKASSAYWILEEQIEKIKRLSFAFPSEADPGLTIKQYAAIHLKVPRSGDPEIDEMIRESRRAEFAENVIDTAFCQYVAVGKKNPSIDEVVAKAHKIADALLAEWLKDNNG